jgi:hypothetical protein
LKKLVSSSEAAYLLGLSLQGVHYRIKKGQLESVKKEGKTYVYVDSSLLNKGTEQSSSSSPASEQFKPDEIIKVKDEQIQFLKKSIKFLKRQHQSEIQRLEHNQDKILNVFQSEVDLLKSAFNEMKNIYALEHNKADSHRKTAVDRSIRNDHMEFMDIKEFFFLMKEHRKTDSQIKKLILERVRAGDKRFIYNRKNKEVLIYKSDFLDLI